MSKVAEAPTPREKLYQRLPAKLVLYLTGACRPVLPRFRALSWQGKRLPRLSWAPSLDNEWLIAEFL
jgi:hypothetical protein